ncbi:hypothetical protein [Chitinophaga alhagiae]|uniref:hypothetical protein n=1 Tax=Chitinophaga alhagiae TaxID=2203219 RepID=UPI000E5AE8F2|nr:hypothetical protein [Chitinophaga alhagiae]
MKHYFILLSSLLLFTAATAQERQQPVFVGKDRQFEKFANNHFRVPPQLTETMGQTCDTLRLLFSFVVNKDGRADSLFFHECTSHHLENEVRRFMARQENTWQPSLENGQPVSSAPLYMGLFVISDECETNKRGSAALNRNYFWNYPHKKLPNWREGSIVFKTMESIFYGAIPRSITAAPTPSKPVPR